MKKLELKIPPLIIALFFGIMAWSMPSPYTIYYGRVSTIISIFILLFGVIISLMGVLEFRKLKTTVNPMSPEDSNTLVVNGIFNISRNPMYVGFLSWIIALVVYLGNPLSMIFAVAFIFYMNIFQIVPEEVILERKFGESYLEYKESVRRWV